MRPRASGRRHAGGRRGVRPGRARSPRGSRRATQRAASARATTPPCCAVPDGRVVVSTDLLVEGRHFRRDWASAADIGHKAAAANLSDINAMGGRRHRADGRARRAGRPARCAWALDLADGIAEEAALVGRRASSAAT